MNNFRHYMYMSRSNWKCSYRETMIFYQLHSVQEFPMFHLTFHYQPVSLCGHLHILTILMIKNRRSISFLNSNLRNKVTKMLGHEPFEKVNNLAILIKLAKRTTNNLNCAWKVSVNFQKLLSSDSSYILHIFTGYFLYQNYIFMQKCNKKNHSFCDFSLDYVI